MAVTGRLIVAIGTSCKGTRLWVAKVSQRHRSLLGDASIIHNHHLTENIARIGLNYSFWSSPN